MKGRVFLFVFALPFAAVGVWAGFGIGSTLYDAWRMQDWQPVEARLIDAGYSSHDGDDAVTYEAFASYVYRVNGVEYSGSRVAINAGADNVGGFQTRLGRHLQEAVQLSGTVIAYYDPAAPEHAVIDRSLRWGLLGFKTIFMLVFGGFGLGMIVFVLWGPRTRVADASEYQASPWLLKEEWQSPVIKSGSRVAMFGTWAFAALWNLIALPLPFLLIEEVLEKRNYPALLGLMFPLIGLGLIAWALQRTREWRRFGAAPVTLDPFPGAIGGHVGGSMALRLPYAADRPFKVSLTCIRSSASGSGKNRSRSEKALWQDDILATAEPGPEGTRLLFRFDVPEGLRQSDAVSNGKSSCLWRLNVSAELPGADLDRVYEIPVYPTGERSAALPEDRLREARIREERIDDDRVRQLLNFGYGPNGKQIFCPAGRNKGMASVGFLIGSVFAGVGWFLLTRQSEVVMGLVFGIVGSLVGLGMLYTALNSLTVTVDAGRITAHRRILGLTVYRKTMRRDRVAKLHRQSSLQSRSGGKHVMYFKVQAIGSDGDSLTIAEGLKGEGDARAAIRLIRREFGIEVRADRHDPGNGDELDILAADG